MIEPLTRTIRMAWSDLRESDKANVTDVLDSGWLSRRKYIPQFEQAVAHLHGQSYGTLMNSGTDALRIGLLTLKEIHGWRDGDEVLVPAVTFIATANAIRQANLEPVFVDVDSASYTLNPDKIEERLTFKARAILPVHLLGLPADMTRIMDVAHRHDLRVLEDSCECVGVHVIWGVCAAFSFYMAHHLQTGVGGMLTTNDVEIDRLARSYMNHGRTEDTDKFVFERQGYSSRSTELEAALGCAQMGRVNENLIRRQTIARKLVDAFKDRTADVQVSENVAGSSWMFFPLVLKRRNRDALMAHLKVRGIESRQMMPLTNQKPYKHFVHEGQYPVAEWLNANGICLPCHPMLSDEDVDMMGRAVQEFFD